MLRSEDIRLDHQKAIENFKCDDEPIVRNFLTEEALSHHNNDLVKTRLYFDKEDNLVGFTSLYNDMMTIGKDKRRKHGLQNLPSLKYYPAIKLHYICVDNRYRGKGYGRELLTSVFVKSLEIANSSGCIFLNLESLPNAVSFYEKYQFQRLSRNGIYMNMFFKLSEL